MACNKENELSKLRRAIEDQRMKAERVDILGKPQASGGCGYPYSSSGGGAAPHHSTSSPETENAYPVFVSPDHEHWSSAASTASGHTMSISAGSTLTRSNVDNLSPDSSINKRVSSGSLSSVSSHISGSSSSTGSSGPEIEAAMKQSKKKRWLPLKSAFSKGSKSQSSSQPDLLDSEDSGCPLSPTLSRRTMHTTTGSIGSTSESEAIQELLQVVQEKERKLTDVRLEALTSQHQIHQLREQITQMQNEMQLLRLENERLQAENTRNSNSSSEERLYTPPPYGTPNSAKPLARPASSGIISSAANTPNTRGGRSLSCSQSPVTSPLHRPQYADAAPTAYSCFPALDCRNLQNTLSPDSEGDGFQVKFVVTSSSTMLPGKRSVVIGSLPVPRRATWDELDRVAQSILTEYCRVVDGDSRMGLSASSIESYNVGDLKREIGGKTPDLLPCAYIVGDVDTVEIKLNDATMGCVDQMAFDMLISRDTLECYISLLLQNKRVVLQGPSGTGKTAFAMSLAEYIVARLRAEGGNTMVAVIDAIQDGQEKLQRYLADLASCNKSVESPTVPAVLVVENLHLITPLTKTLEQLLSLSAGQGRTPYIIVTMQPGNECPQTLREDFKWISCGCESPHVQRYLTRALRRTLVEHLLTSPHTCARENGKLSSIVLWIPLCWQHINRFLESQNLQYASLGPNMFLKGPMSVTSSCSWFIGIWNHSIIPYLASVMRTAPARPANQNWEDPSKWVISSFPWDMSETGINPAKAVARLQAQDIEQLPSYPEPDAVDGNLSDLPLPPPPPAVGSSSSGYIKHTFQPPCATSSPIRVNSADNQNGLSRPSNGCTNNTSNTSKPIWQKQSGCATLNRASPTPNNKTRNFSTMYSRVGNITSASGNDPLKDMLAQLKRAALNTSEDFDTPVAGPRRGQY